MNILIIGAGQIGSRHLQALARIPELTGVTVVDPDGAARERALQRWMEVAGREEPVTLLSALPEDRTGRFQAAILATNASARLAALQAAIRLEIKCILAEKLLFPSIAQLEQAISLCDEHEVRLYPNHVYRFAQPWAAVAEALAGEPFSMHVSAGNIGLATNLPHWLDLLELLDRSPLADLSIELHEPPFKSKRGGELVEVSGTARARTVKGAGLTMTFSGPASPPVIELRSARGFMTMNEADQTATGTLLEAPVSYETPFVSQTTALAIPQIISGRTVLPTLRETSGMNRLFLKAMAAAILGKASDDQIVPVT